MKLLSFVCLMTTYAHCYAQANNYKCSCDKIGINASWADSNKVVCYQIPVARDVSNRSTGEFKLAVLVAPSLRTTNAKPLLYLHGGPGIATLENVPRYLKTPTWELIRQQRSIVFFDYRGTGFSEPALCANVGDSLATAARKNLSPSQMQSYKIELYRKCRLQLQSEDIDISTLNSFQLSEDAESIRKSLRIDKWNVYGVSHGTTVALNLLRNHDEHIQSVILDSPFPPNAPWLDFVRPFAVSFKVLEQKIEEDPAASSQFPDIKSDFVRAVERLNKTPYKMARNESGPTYPFTGDDFAWSIWSALLKPAAIPFVPLAIKEVANGNDSILSKWAVAFSDPNAYGKFSDFQSKAVLCYEGRPKSESDTRASLGAKYPEFASFNIDFEDELCNAWQPKSAGSEAFEPVVSNIPVLILSGEYDPVCPPLFGELTAKSLSASTFISVPAASHAAIHVDDCIRNIANTFLSKPTDKVSLACVNNRPKISFVTDSLMKALPNVKKK